MKKVVLFGLILVLLLALGLRLYGLSRESYWNDEAFSVHHAGQKSVSEVNMFVSQTEAVPSGYYILLHYWMKLFGNSEVATRLLSVVFGSVSVLVLFLIVQRLFDANVALLSSFFMAISMLEVLYSQEARVYILFTFLVLLSVYFFVRIYQNRGMLWGRGKWWYLGYFVSLVLALYVNYVGLFVIFLFSLLLFFYREEAADFSMRMWILHGFLLVCFVGLLPMLLRQFGTLNGGLTHALVSKKLPAFLASLGLVFYTLPFIFFILLGVFVFLFRERWQRWFCREEYDYMFLGLLLVFGAGYLYLCFKPLLILGLPLVRTPIVQSYFLIRHLFFLAPLVYVYLGYRILLLRSKRWMGIAVVFLILVNVVALGVYYHSTTKPQWREVVEEIESKSAGEPLVLLDKGGFSNEFLLTYYFHHSFSLVKLSWSEDDRVLHQVDEEKLWDTLQARGDFWLVLSKNPRTGDYYQKLLDEYFVRDYSGDFFEITLYHYVAAAGSLHSTAVDTSRKVYNTT